MINDFDFYELPCNRFYNLFHMFNFKFFILIALIIFGSTLSFCIKVSDMSDILPFSIVGFVFGLILALLIIIAKMLSYPKCIDVNTVNVKFEKRHNLLNALLHSSSRLSYGHAGTTNYRIYNIKSIKFHQTSFEKKNNIGSIEFMGDILGVDEENEVCRDEKMTKYVIHGVKDFEDMSKWILNHIEIN